MTTLRYTRTAMSLHWLVALLIFAGWGLGYYMEALPLSPDKLRYYSWHKWIGVTVFLLVIVRTAWRLTHTPPPEPADIPHWQVRIAQVVHGLLYFLMWALPLSGWLMSSAKGFTTMYFGVIPLPDLLAKDPALGETLEALHAYLAYTLAFLVALHAAAALKHQFIDKDGLIQRMLP